MKAVVMTALFAGVCLLNKYCFSGHFFMPKIDFAIKPKTFLISVDH